MDNRELQQLAKQNRVLQADRFSLRSVDCPIGPVNPILHVRIIYPNPITLFKYGKCESESVHATLFVTLRLAGLHVQMQNASAVSSLLHYHGCDTANKATIHSRLL